MPKFVEGRRALASTLIAIIVLLTSQVSAFAKELNPISALLNRDAVEWSGRSFPTERMRVAYENRDYLPIWMSNGQLNTSGEALLDELANSYRDGLDPAEYLAGLRGFSEVVGSEDAARLELALSHAFLTLGHDLFSGITTPSVTDPNIVIKRKKIDATQWLEGAATTGPARMFATLRPAHPQYAQLRQMLGGYRSLLLRGGWKPISKGKTLKPGMRDPRVAQMRENLSARGYDSLNTNEPELYDDALKEVVAHFQRRHGLSPDGVAGPNTFRAMSVSAEERVRQLAINLERWRWLPRRLGQAHVLVNQAGFEMFTIKNGKTIDQRRVIVGKPYHQSPMFSDEIIYSEFNPTWTVPFSIASKEMLPKIRENPAYLASRDYKIFRGGKEVNPYAVDWSAISARNFPYRIVQAPGEKNALGRVKFIFPNKFSVYLHDTPARNLFSRYGRAFSHGCIRVDKPIEFAGVLYKLQGGLNPSKIKGILNSKKRTRINFKRKMPVHLAYFTAWVDSDGIPQFFDDVYKRDTLVSKYLF